MRGVSRWASRVAPLLAGFVVFGASAWADEPPAGPPDPPQARINPPVGVSSQSRMQPPVGITPPPPPATTPQARLKPPDGAPMTLADMILMWLQSRLSVPNG